MIRRKLMVAVLALAFITMPSLPSIGEFGPTMKERRDMASKHQQDRQTQIDNEILRKQAKAVKREARAVEYAFVQTSSYLTQAVNLIRIRQYHVIDDIASIRTEIATYTDEDLTAINVILDALEAECEEILIQYPEGWPGEEAES